MAGRHMSRVLLKMMWLRVTMKAFIKGDNGLVRVLDFSGVITNPLLKSFTWDANRSPDADEGQLACSHHREHLRPAEAEKLGDLRRFKQQWLQSHPILFPCGLAPEAPPLPRRGHIGFGSVARMLD
jgi:hypothetical protein